jgi:hypothetical protein
MNLFEDIENNLIVKFLIPEKKIDINPKEAFKALFNKDNKGRRIKEFKKKWKGDKVEDCKLIPWNMIIYRFIIVSIIVQTAFSSLGTILKGIPNKILDFFIFLFGFIPFIGRFGFVFSKDFISYPLLGKYGLWSIFLQLLFAPGKMFANLGFGIYYSRQSWNKLKCCSDKCAKSDEDKIKELEKTIKELEEKIEDLETNS